MANSTLNKEFTVQMTKAKPNTTKAYDTYTFKCGNFLIDANSRSGQAYRGSVHISEYGGVAKDNCDISIYGLDINTLSDLTFLVWNPVKGVDPRNTVSVIVDGVTVFTGNTYAVYSDFTSAPDVCLRITGVMGLYINSLLKNDTEIKSKDNRSIREVFTTLGNEAGMKCVFSEDITGVCPDITLHGSVREQLLQLGEGLNLNVNISCNIIRVAPFGHPLPSIDGKGGSAIKNSKLEDRSPITLVDAQHGLIGYPTFTNQGVNFKAIFDPHLRTGQYVDIQSIVPNVSGRFLIVSKNTQISTLPNGQWASDYTTFAQRGG